MRSVIEEAIERAVTEKEIIKDHRYTSVDEELERVLRESRAKIKVIGTGGAGSNAIDRLMETGVIGVEAIAVNTDAQYLLHTRADKKILIGKEVTRGLGAGNDPKVGEESAREDERVIKDVLEGSDMVFVTCGLGGGTGTGSAPVISEIAKKLGALTVAVVTLPFTVEGLRRQRNAEKGLEKLRKVTDTVIVIPNDKLLDIAPGLPINAAFKVSDDILIRAVGGIAELITKPGLVNVDFADVRSVMKEGDVAMIGIGESDTENRAKEAITEALSSPLIDVDVTGAKGALINITGSSNMKLEEAEKIVEHVTNELEPDAQIIWGAMINEDVKNGLRVMVVLSGVKSPYIFGRKETEMLIESETPVRGIDLGIEYI